MTHYAVIMKSKAFSGDDYITRQLIKKRALYPQLCILIPRNGIEQVNWVEAAGIPWTLMNSDNKRDVRTTFVFSYPTCEMGALVQMFKDTGWDVHNYVMEGDYNADYIRILKKGVDLL